MVASGTGVSVGGTYPAWVGINVEVTKSGCAVGCAFESTEMETQEAKINTLQRKIFFHIKTPLASEHHHLSRRFFHRVTGDLFFKRVTRQNRDLKNGAQQTIFHHAAGFQLRGEGGVALKFVGG